MQQHRLVAIMFTDIVGYTALMGSDQERTFEELLNNGDIHTLLLEKYNGAPIKEMGDVVMASFSSAYNAVKCGINIQQKANKNLKNIN